MAKLLRKCRYCGREALSEKDLELFTKAQKYRYGRRNICKECFAAIIRKGGKYHETHKKASENWRLRNPEHEKERLNRRITFKTESGFERIALKESPRKGICEECGAAGETNLHHDVYDPKDVVAHTRELCNSCHAKHHRLKEFEAKGFIKNFKKNNVLEKDSLQRWTPHV